MKYYSMQMLTNDQLRLKASKIRYFFTDIDGTLTDGSTYYSATGEALKKFSHVDGTGFLLLRNAGIIAGLITGESNDIILRRSEKLKINYCFTGINNKMEIMKQFAEEHQISMEEIAYIGDDLNDLAVIENAGLSFAPSNAHPLVILRASICCKSQGGSGAFREAVEQLLLMKNIDILNTFNTCIL